MNPFNIEVSLAFIRTVELTEDASSGQALWIFIKDDVAFQKVSLELDFA